MIEKFNLISNQLTLNKNRPTFVFPPDIPLLKIKKANILIILACNPILTMGNSTRLKNVIYGLSQKIKSKKDIRIYYLGFKPNFLIPKNINLLSYFKNDGQNKNIENLVYDTITLLKDKFNLNNIGILSTFHSGNNFRIIKKNFNKKSDINITFIGCESSFSYTNEPENELLTVRRRKDVIERKYFSSTKNINAFFLRPLTPYLPINMVLTKVPKNTYIVSTMSPIINSKFDHTNVLNSKDVFSNKEMKSIFQKNMPIVYLATNEGCFDAGKVNTWWTEAQYKDILKSTDKLTYALYKFVSTHKKSVILLTNINAQKHILNAHKDRIQILNNIDIVQNSRVYIAKIPTLSKKEHHLLMKLANIVIHRTSQANTYTEALYVNANNVIYTMPGKGYMDAEKIDEAVAYLYKLVNLNSRSSLRTVCLIIDKFLTNRSYLRRLQKNQIKSLLLTNCIKNVEFNEVILSILGHQSRQ